MIGVRFAPSPTGLLHVGNTRTALMNWLFARHHGGRFTLRLDDTDVQRSTAESEESIRQDLQWLGLDWDDSFRQSDRLARYAEVAETLKASGRLYPCFESEEELKVKRDLRIRRGKPPVYDRAMLKLTPEQRASAEAGGKRPYWRFLLSDAEVTWNDLVLGAAAGEAACGVRSRADPRRRHAAVHVHLGGGRYRQGGQPHHPRRGPHHQYRGADRPDRRPRRQSRGLRLRPFPAAAGHRRRQAVQAVRRAVAAQPAP